MTSLTPEENALVAYAILDEVNGMMSNGARPEDITRDIARAQVYATLATVPVRPDTSTIAKVISDSLSAKGFDLDLLEADDAAEAVRGLL